MTSSNLTNVYATTEEIDEIKCVVARGQQLPFTASVFGPQDNTSMDEAIMLCHKTALNHGLPEIEGFYGLDENGQFITEDKP